MMFRCPSDPRSAPACPAMAVSAAATSIMAPRADGLNLFRKSVIFIGSFGWPGPAGTRQALLLFSESFGAVAGDSAEWSHPPQGGLDIPTISDCDRATCAE